MRWAGGSSRPSIPVTGASDDKSSLSRGASPIAQSSVRFDFEIERQRADTRIPDRPRGCVAEVGASLDAAELRHLDERLLIPAKYASHSSAVGEMRPKGRASELERRRQRAIALLERGHVPVDVAQMLGVDRRSVRESSLELLQGG